MQATNRSIQLFITIKDVSDKAGQNCMVVKNGLSGLSDIIPIIHFNGEEAIEAIYVHLNKPIPAKEAYLLISKWCKELEKRGKINYSEIQSLAMPSSGGVLHPTFDVNNNIVENRYLIVFNV